MQLTRTIFPDSTTFIERGGKSIVARNEFLWGKYLYHTRQDGVTSTPVDRRSASGITNGGHS
jgi:hypothetical protein